MRGCLKSRNCEQKEAIWLKSSIDNETDCVGRASLAMTINDF